MIKKDAYYMRLLDLYVFYYLIKNIFDNKKYGIIPQTIKKPIENNLLSLVASYRDLEDIVAEEMVDMGIDKKDLPKLIDKLEKDMHKAAKILDFERAAEIRDKLKKLREMLE